MEALSERVSLLERTLSGGAAFPRPGAPAEHPAPVDSAPVGRRPAASPPPAAAAGGSPPGDVGRRPSIGAVRRSQQAPGAAAEPPAEAAAPVPDPVPARPDATARRPTAASPAAVAVDRDSLTEAWGDGILRALPARAKALYSAGRFVNVDEQGAHFALPNAAHRDRCADLVPAVEAALTAHFGTPVTLVLHVDDAAPPAAGAAPGRPAPGAGGARSVAAGDDDLDHADAADLLLDAPDADADQASAAQARLLEAFPGASEVAG